MKFQSVRRAAAVLVLLLAAVSTRAALTGGPEQPVSRVEYGAAFGPTRMQDVATDGTDFLTVWLDQTPGRDGLYASVVSASRPTRPSSPEPLVRGFGTAYAVWTGESYLVLLARYLDARVIRLDRDGVPLAPARPLDLDGAVYGLEWNGHNALTVVWSADGTKSVALLDATGAIVRKDIRVPSTLGRDSWTVAAAGSTFIAAWAEELERQIGGEPPLTQVRVVRISANGDVAAPFLLLPPTRAFVELASASGALRAGFAFTTNDLATTKLTRIVLYETTATVEGDSPVEIEQWGYNLRVTTAGSGFVATYIHSSTADSHLSALSFGSANRRSIVFPAPVPYGVQLQSTGEAVAAIWGIVPARATFFDAAITHPTGEVGAAAVGAVRQSSPSIAAGGSGALVAWVEAGTILRGRRFDAAGNALDAEPFLLATNATDAGQPAITFTGDVWLVAWTGGGEHVFVRRISPAGVVLSAAIDVGEGTLPALASNGTTAVLAMEQRTASRVSIVRFTRAGDRIDSSPLPLAGVRSADPAIASNGQGFLVTWTEGARADSPYLPGILSQRLDVSGSPLDGMATPVAVGALEECDSQVASIGSDYAVAWVQWNPPPRTDPSLLDLPPPVFRIFSKRVLGNGVLADFTAGQDGALIGEGVQPTISAAADRYVVTSAFTEGMIWPALAFSDGQVIRATTLDLRGMPLDQQRVVGVAPSSPATRATATIGGTTWLAYSRTVAELANVQRVFLRPLTEGAPRRRATR